jgi:hypothetical protein
LPSTKNCCAAPSVVFDLSKVGIEGMLGGIVVDTRLNGLQAKRQQSVPGKCYLERLLYTCQTVFTDIHRYSPFAVAVKGQLTVPHYDKHLRKFFELRQFTVRSALVELIRKFTLEFLV